MPDSSSPAGDAESSSGLMLAIRKFFDPDYGERSLRAQLEDAIDEHEDENGDDTHGRFVAGRAPDAAQPAAFFGARCR
jgi:hypothetical protein